MISRLNSTTLTCIFAIGALSAAVAPARADEVTQWNKLATDVAAAAHTDPLTESRAFAMLHVAMHDAINAAEPRYEGYLRQVQPARDASAPAAAAVAAHDTLVVLFPSGRDAFDAALDSLLGAAGRTDAVLRGIAAGHAAARAVLDKRSNDGSDRSVPYTAGSKPGLYRPTPPDLTPAWRTQWGGVTPFALRSSSQFRPEPPPAVDTARARFDVDVVRAIGGKDSSARTDEQTEIARFWYENSTQGWNRIARTVSDARGLDLHESARLFALLNVAMADGFIAGFEAKYHYAFWRPVTAIRDAGDDTWLSFLGTPPIPDYPSNHTVLGASAATVLCRFFGTDFVAFQTTSGDPYPGITRSFWSFSEAARENGASRVFAGIHFPTAVAAGYAQGDAIGTYVFEHALKPLEQERASASAPVRAAR
jgi:hypothetical protein